MNPAKLAMLYGRMYIESGLLFDIVKHEYLEPDPLLYWRLKSKKDVVAVNSLGTRGPEFSIKKQKDVFRIVCLGDSCTYGAYIENDAETYAKRLETMLNSNNNFMRYEVINVGVPGYSSYQALLNLEKRIKYWEPNLVTVYIGNNSDYDINRYYPLEPLINWPIILKITNFLDCSYLFQLLKSYTLKLRVFLMKTIYKDFPSEYRKSAFQVLEKHFLKMAQIAKENNFKIIFLNYPYLSDGGTIVEQAEINQSIEKAVKEAKVPLVDILKALKGQGGKKLFVDEIHPNSTGHQVIATTIFDTLLREGIIPEGDYKIN